MGDDPAHEHRDTETHAFPIWSPDMGWPPGLNAPPALKHDGQGVSQRQVASPPQYQ